MVGTNQDVQELRFHCGGAASCRALGSDLAARLLRMPAKGLAFGRSAWRHLLMLLYRPLFGSHGRNFRFDPHGSYTYSNIHVGDDVSLGWRPILMAALSEIRIGSKVMFGPQVVIIGGGHNTSVLEQFMSDISEKRPEDDRGVVIEDDVWVGARAMILRGAVIGRGSIIGAGAVVTKRVPPYAVVAGVPARVVKFRWDVNTILQHEAALYPPERRLTREALETIQDDGDPGAGARNATS